MGRFKFGRHSDKTLLDVAKIAPNQLEVVIHSSAVGQEAIQSPADLDKIGSTAVEVATWL